MATPLPTSDVLGVFKSIKDQLRESLLDPRGLSVKSCGTKALPLSEPTDPSTGYWTNPQQVSSKPPRWVVQVETDAAGVATARLALDPNNQPYGMARTVGYINNRDGTCAVAAFRVLLAVRPYGAQAWDFPAGWECVLFLAFPTPLPAGTSGDALSDFNAGAGTIDFGGGSARRTYQIALRALVQAPGATPSAGTLTYDDASAAVAALAGAQLYDGAQAAERDRLAADMQAIFATAPSGGPFTLAEDTNLVGIDPLVYRQIEAAVNSGKRHIILYGPPGTGKTTLAEYLARELSERDNGDGSYLMLTASSSWSAQDLVGGYQPMGNGSIGFIPGALLRDFDKPAIIDELNRCPIDKVLGPLFSVLSGQSSTLPCRTDVTDATSPFHVIHPEPRNGMAPHEHAPAAAWRLICTLNTYDKTQLGQISYALSRRFAWIKVGAPVDTQGFVVEMAGRFGIAVSVPPPANPVGQMWQVVNGVREIGGAPVVDFLKTLRALDGGLDPFAVPLGAGADVFLATFRMCVLPLMDGLSPRQASDLAAGIAAVWQLDSTRATSLVADCAEFAA
jgi:5-methylcytosine-specific restriction protein B